MSKGDEVFRRLQSAARSVAARTGTGAPTQEFNRAVFAGIFLGPNPLRSAPS